MFGGWYRASGGGLGRVSLILSALDVQPMAGLRQGLLRVASLPRHSRQDLGLKVVGVCALGRIAWCAMIQ